MEQSPPPNWPRCPNCSQPTPPGATHCPRCGARLSTEQLSAMSVVGMIFAGLVALSLGSFGACALILGGSALASSGADRAFGLMFAALGVGALAVAFFCVRYIWNKIRPRRDRP